MNLRPLNSNIGVNQVGVQILRKSFLVGLSLVCWSFVSAALDPVALAAEIKAPDPQGGSSGWREQLMNRQDAQSLKIFESATRIFGNFRLDFVESVEIPKLEPGRTRILVLGREDCVDCQRLTGDLLRYVGKPSGNRSNIEVVFARMGSANWRNAPILRMGLAAGAFGRDLEIPEIVIQKGAQLMGAQARDAFMNELLRGPSQNYADELVLAEDQLNVSRLFVTSVGPDIEAADEEAVRTMQPAGVLIYKSDPSGLESAQLAAAFNRLQRQSQTQLFVAVDQEGGNVQRIRAKDICPLPHAEKLENRPDIEIQKFAEIMARDLIRSGVNTNFAPVLDLKGKKNEDISGVRRSISAKPEEVLRVARIINRTLQKQGIYTFAKHFPGIGESRNTHQETAIIEATYSTMRNSALLPFLGLKEDETPPTGVMVGHVLVKDYDRANPLVFSADAISRLVRSDFGFGGLVINDAFHMRASTFYRSEIEAPYYAILAGVAPIFVNSVSFENSVKFVVSRLRNPAVSENEKNAARLALKNGLQKINEVKARFNKIRPTVNLTTGCNDEDKVFLKKLSGSWF